MQSTVLISGANSGMGLAIALLLAEHGFEIYAGARTAEGRVEIAERPNDRCASHRSASMFRTPTPRCKVARNRPTAESLPKQTQMCCCCSLTPLCALATYEGQRILRKLANAMRVGGADEQY